MKKMFLGVVLGAVAGAVGYKLYKEREDEIKDFLDEYISDEDDFDVDSVDVEDLEDLRDCIDEMIDTKLKVDDSFEEDGHVILSNSDESDEEENKEEYIFIDNTKKNNDGKIIDLTEEHSVDEKNSSDDEIK
ncbi:MAG: hypothetical protein RR561_03780 [Peptostreptococcus sp.]|uniref:hypothetical protein n=1 Tax=Peptostreptococcus sp. TaxID=1262 RepID=UPI002FC98789